MKEVQTWFHIQDGGNLIGLNGEGMNHDKRERLLVKEIDF